MGHYSFHWVFYFGNWATWQKVEQPARCKWQFHDLNSHFCCTRGWNASEGSLLLVYLGRRLFFSLAASWPCRRVRSGPSHGLLRSVWTREFRFRPLCPVQSVQAARANPSILSLWRSRRPSVSCMMSGAEKRCITWQKRYEEVTMRHMRIFPYLSSSDHSSSFNPMFPVVSVSREL